MGYAFPNDQHAAGTIEPCVIILGGHEHIQTRIYHLLNCGHVVVIKGEDTQCGSNCQEAVDTTSSFTSPCPITGETLYWTTMKRPDSLYCEICQGIPWESYRKMQYDPLRSTIPTPRPCHALTRGDIAAAIQVPHVGVQILLASPLPKAHYDAHNLCCGHRVWCAFPRSCARNCSHETPCRDDPAAPFWIKQDDVIFCEECVSRAERVHTRWNIAASERSLDLTYDTWWYGGDQL